VARFRTTSSPSTLCFWPFGVQFPESKHGAFADFDRPCGKFAIASLEGVDRGLNLEKNDLSGRIGTESRAASHKAWGSIGGDGERELNRAISPLRQAPARLAGTQVFLAKADSWSRSNRNW
jgi:hypothetical protein